MKRDDHYYQAMLARDHRFDGKFFVGVRTTGIYCRPICPAKPKRENVEFFTSHLEAEKAGYRPCLRCRPETAPRSPAWVGKSAIVQRALKALHQAGSAHVDENQFAARFGVSARHLRRVFNEEIGKTPKQLCFENRLNLARQLLSETALPVTQVAFASGFRSVRRFNDAFKDRFHRAPSEIRRAKAAPGNPLSIALPYRPPYDFAGLMHFYRAHQTGDLEWFEDGKMYRVVEAGGKCGILAVADEPGKSQLRLEIDFPITAQLHTILARVRAMFDLDSDPIVVANSLESCRKVKALLKKNPGIRLPSGWDPFEVAVSAILGQLVTVDFGRQLVRDLIELLGEDSGLKRDGKPIKLFPSARKIASSSLEGLRTTGARKKTLIEFAGAVAANEISLEPAQDVDLFLKQILSIRGIGPWTANYIAMKALRHTDAFPATDLILARALELHSPETVDKMRPWRAYAAALFWRSYSETLKKRSRV